jgi:hypothetical protein
MPTPTDDLTLIKSFRAEREAEPAEAREAIWAALEARMELAEPPRVQRPTRRRRRLGLAFAGATFAAAVVAGALVLNSGPTAQPAGAAEILHQAADAAAELPTTSVPGPGEFLYRKEQRIDVEGWRHPMPPLDADIAGGSIGGTMHGPHAFNASVPVTTESWTDEKGGGRRREELGPLQFWSKAEEAHWQAAGSPLPSPFDPEFQQRYKDTAFGKPLEVNSEVVDQETDGFGNFTFPDTSKLPTEGKALRLATEANELDFTGFNHIAKGAPSLDPQQTTEELFNVLQEGFPTPQLQAAIFDALAELPGITVDREATDGLGRDGDAIKTKVSHGVSSEYLFDPETGELLAQRSTLVDPTVVPYLAEVPAGTVISERDFIAEAGVGSTTETGASTGDEAG